MERRLKERLTGAAVLVMLAVIFIPMVLDNSSENENKITLTNIPPKPDTNFRSRIIPVEEPTVDSQSGQVELVPAKQAQGAGSVEDNKPEEDLELATVSLSNTQQPEEDADDNLEAIADASEQSRGLTAWVVQLGSFSSQENAKGLILRLQNRGYAAYIEEITGDSSVIFRVRVGPELKKAEAETTLRKLTEEFKLEGILLSYP